MSNISGSQCGSMQRARICPPSIPPHLYYTPLPGQSVAAWHQAFHHTLYTHRQRHVHTHSTRHRSLLASVNSLPPIKGMLPNNAAFYIRLRRMPKCCALFYIVPHANRSHSVHFLENYSTICAAVKEGDGSSGIHCAILKVPPSVFFFVFVFVVLFYFKAVPF